MTGEPGHKLRVVSQGPKQARGGKGPNYGPRIAALERRMDTMENTVAEVKSDTSEILSVLTAAKTVGGFSRKYGGRILTFLGGIAVAKGFLSPDTLQSFLHIFS